MLITINPRGGDKSKTAKKNMNMEFLELPSGGTHQPFSDARRGGRTQVDEAEDDLISFRDPGHRAGPGGLD